MYIEFLRRIHKLPLTKDEVLFLLLMEGEVMDRKKMKLVFLEDEKWINWQVTKLFREKYLKKVGRGNIYALSKKGVDTVRSILEQPIHSSNSFSAF